MLYVDYTSKKKPACGSIIFQNKIYNLKEWEKNIEYTLSSAFYQEVHAFDTSRYRWLSLNTCLMWYLSKFLHCKVSIFLFEIMKYLVKRYFETMQISYFSYVHLLILACIGGLGLQKSLLWCLLNSDFLFLSFLLYLLIRNLCKQEQLLLPLFIQLFIYVTLTHRNLFNYMDFNLLLSLFVLFRLSQI